MTTSRHGVFDASWRHTRRRCARQRTPFVDARNEPWKSTCKRPVEPELRCNNRRACVVCATRVLSESLKIPAITTRAPCGALITNRCLDSQQAVNVGYVNASEATPARRCCDTHYRRMHSKSLWEITTILSPNRGYVLALRLPCEDIPLNVVYLITNHLHVEPKFARSLERSLRSTSPSPSRSPSASVAPPIVPK